MIIDDILITGCGIFNLNRIRCVVKNRKNVGEHPYIIYFTDSTERAISETDYIELKSMIAQKQATNN